MIASRPPATFPDTRLVLMSTANAPLGEELDYWHDVTHEKICPMQFKKIGEESFRGDLSMPFFGEVGLSELQISPHVMERDAASLSQGGQLAVFFFVMSGSIESVQGGAPMHLSSGAGALSMGDRLCSYMNREPLRMLNLCVPKVMLDCGMDDLQRLAHLDLNRHSSLFPVLRTYVTQLATLNGGIEAHTAARVGRNVADLVSAVVAEVKRSSPLNLSAYKHAALMRVQSFVDEHLDNPELNPATVSQVLRLSPRYINRMLEAEGTSLGRMIWNRRLERIARDLRDPALATRSISMIALAHGFNDLAHFSKAFRRRYAMPPRDYRRTEALA